MPHLMPVAAFHRKSRDVVLELVHGFANVTSGLTEVCDREML